MAGPAARCREFLNAVLHLWGLHLTRRERAFEMDNILAAAARRGTEIKTWIDVGASDGSWSLAARRYFPDANYILFEPLLERQPRLHRLERKYGFKHIAAAAGPERGMISFQVDSQLDGSSVTAINQPGSRSVPVETIDAAVASTNWPAPFGIKLDTHGYEVPILDGAIATLRSAQLIIIEVYNFDLTPQSLRFPQICLEMERRGFRCCDLADPLRRPTDGTLWQMDLAFAPASSAVFQSARYK